MGAHDMGLGSANIVTIAGPIMAQNHGLFHGHPCYQIWTSEPYFNALCGMSVLYVAVLPFNEPDQLCYAGKSLIHVLFISLKVVIIIYESKKTFESANKISTSW